MRKQCGFRTGPTQTEMFKAQKMARDWKFWIENIQEMHYPCCENKGTDQLRSDQLRSDLRLCLHICRMLVFSSCGSFINVMPSRTVLSNRTLQRDRFITCCRPSFSFLL